MVSKLSGFWEVLPYVAMISVEFSVVGATTLNEAAMLRGASPFVLIVYSNAIGALILLLSSYVLERKRDPLTFPLFCRFFFLGLIGMTAMQNLAFIGIKYSSPTLGSAMGTMLPAYTFILAVFFRLVELKLRRPSTQAKVIGTLICVSGGLIVSLYKGPKIWSLPSSLSALLFSQHSHPQSEQRKNWIFGALFLFAATLCVAFWNILQARVLKGYPWAITVVAFNVVSSTFQSAIISLIAERKNPIAWRIKNNIELIAIIYTGIITNVIAFNVQTWCIRTKGPIFMVMFKPLGIIISAFMATLLLGEILYLGGVIGGIIIMVGFYSVMWGHTKEEKKGHDLQDNELDSSS